VACVKVEVGTARIGVEVADPAFADALRAHLQQRLQAALDQAVTPELPVVHDEDLEAVPGALVLVRVGQRSPAELLAHVERLEAAGARGLQLVWSGRPRSAERAVFHVLEAWRGARRRCPLMLAPDEVPAPFLLRAIALTAA
jgi:hypothetical protein